MTLFQRQILENLWSQVRGMSGSLVFTDGEDERIVLAACKLVARSGIRPILVGRRSVIRYLLPSVHYQRRVSILDITDPRQRDVVVDAWHISGLYEDFKGYLEDPSYVGAILVRTGYAVGMVGGASVPTATVLRAGLRVIGTDPEYPLVSGAFGMILPTPLPNGTGVLIFGDAAVNPRPTAAQLTIIAQNSASVAQQVFGLEPRVGLMSFSTKGSANHADVRIVQEALRVLEESRTWFAVDGEMQADAAIIPEVAVRKAPQSPVAGNANVLVFPNLDAANIAYKLVQRIGGAVALGVILSGFSRPINDLSRGCTIDDVVHIALVTMLQARRLSDKNSINGRSYI